MVRFQYDPKGRNFSHFDCLGIWPSDENNAMIVVEAHLDRIDRTVYMKHKKTSEIFKFRVLDPIFHIWAISVKTHFIALAKNNDDSGLGLVCIVLTAWFI